jgi:hypothetical protein
MIAAIDVIDMSNNNVVITISCLLLCNAKEVLIYTEVGDKFPLFRNRFHEDWWEQVGDTNKYVEKSPLSEEQLDKFMLVLLAILVGARYGREEYSLYPPGIRFDGRNCGYVKYIQPILASIALSTPSTFANREKPKAHPLFESNSPVVVAKAKAELHGKCISAHLYAIQEAYIRMRIIYLVMYFYGDMLQEYFGNKENSMGIYEGCPTVDIEYIVDEWDYWKNTPQFPNVLPPKKPKETEESVKLLYHLRDHVIGERASEADSLKGFIEAKKKYYKELEEYNREQDRRDALFDEGIENDDDMDLAPPKSPRVHHVVWVGRFYFPAEYESVKSKVQPKETNKRVQSDVDDSQPAAKKPCVQLEKAELSDLDKKFGIDGSSLFASV